MESSGDSISCPRSVQALADLAWLCWLGARGVPGPRVFGRRTYELCRNGVVYRARRYGDSNVGVILLFRRRLAAPTCLPRVTVLPEAALRGAATRNRDRSRRVFYGFVSIRYGNCEPIARYAREEKEREHRDRDKGEERKREKCRQRK